jgi:hypothetical protein
MRLVQRTALAAVGVLLIMLAAPALMWEPAHAQVLPECRPAATGAATQFFASPEGAVCAVVQAGDSVYAGDCAATESPRDIGKVCSKYIAQRGSLRAYLIGRTFSEFSSWVFVEQKRDGWVAVATTPLDFAAPSLIVPWPENTVMPEQTR